MSSCGLYQDPQRYEDFHYHHSNIQTHLNKYNMKYTGDKKYQEKKHAVESIVKYFNCAMEQCRDE